MRKFNLVRTVRLVPDVFRINLKDWAVPLCLNVPQKGSHRIERRNKEGVREDGEYGSDRKGGVREW